MSRMGVLILIILLYVFDFTVLANIISINFVVDCVVCLILDKFYLKSLTKKKKKKSVK